MNKYHVLRIPWHPGNHRMSCILLHYIWIHHLDLQKLKYLLNAVYKWYIIFQILKKMFSKHTVFRRIHFHVQKSRYSILHYKGWKTAIATGVKFAARAKQGLHSRSLNPLCFVLSNAYEFSYYLFTQSMRKSIFLT